MNPLKKTPALILMAFAGLTFAGQANACSYNWRHPDRYAKCLADEAFDKIVNAGRASAEKITSDAKNLANNIRNDATQAANKTLNAALATAKAAKAAEPQLCE